MIFSWFKKEKAFDIIKLEVDIHSHIIPSIDDGAKDIEESIKLLKELETIGYKKVITTPHIMSDAYKNSATNIYEGLRILQDKMAQEDISLELDVGAEYYLDDGFYDRLKDEHVMSINQKYLLFETSYMSKPMLLEDMIYAISTAGHIPLMAHPERYRYIKNPIEEYKRFKDLGVMFQVNINSFGGYYGQDAKNKALFLSDAGMIDFLGSDVHHIKQLKMLNDVIYTKEYQKIFTNNNILNSTLF